MDKQIISCENKKSTLDSLKPLPKDLIKNLNEWFRVELTYTSNAIEGNTLTRQETAMVVEKGLSVDGKSIQELLEATNHAQAFDFINLLLENKDKRQKIVEHDLLEIHKFILQHIDDHNAGKYRDVAVRIAGSRVVLPNAKKVPELMNDFILWLQGANKDSPIKIAADAHFKLVTIHPFIDGNGRVARLLLDLMLLQNGYPPALIHKEDRRAYINAIEKGQLTDDLTDYYQVIYKAVEASLDIYLEALKLKEDSKSKKTLSKKLLKIGELSLVTGETVSTLRYWTKEGLLIVVSHTKGGYQLYLPDMVERAKEIRKMQVEERLTITEISEAFLRIKQNIIK